MANDLISLRAYSRLRGCSLAAVQKAIKSSRISLIDGKIDPEVADIQWARNTQPDQQERGSLEQFEKSQELLGRLNEKPADQNSNEVQPGAGSLVLKNNLGAEKAETENIRRQLLEMQLAQKRGELVEVESVKRAMEGKLKAAREAFASMADRLAPQLAAETDVTKVDTILRTAIRQAMNNIAQQAPETIN
ncbi:MAG: hypothetical protein ACAH07_05975 [Methylophilaceae bacterium]|nr:hypothetical protein [Methyloradius sp.]